VVEPEGDEVVLDILGDTDSLLYILYYQTDDGNYDFYACVDDAEGIEDIISKDEELEKE
jgi:predicted transcriptional regulator YdeE